MCGSCAQHNKKVPVGLDVATFYSYNFLLFKACFFWLHELHLRMKHWQDRDLMKQVQKAGEEENEAKDEFGRKYGSGIRVK